MNLAFSELIVKACKVKMAVMSKMGKSPYYKDNETMKFAITNSSVCFSCVLDFR